MMIFKLVKSWSNNINLLKIESVRKLYFVMLSKSISANTLLINVEELSLNKNVKYLYFWCDEEIVNEKKIWSFFDDISWF